MPEAKRKWCRIVRMFAKRAIGWTPDDERVWISYALLDEDVEVGDILSFVPQAWKHPIAPGAARIDFYAYAPILIGFSVKEKGQNTQGKKHDAVRIHAEGNGAVIAGCASAGPSCA